MPQSNLLSIFRDLESRSTTTMLRFRDGDAYIVRVISTMHAEEGEDIVAEILGKASVSNSSSIPNGAFIDFVLADVAQVVVDGECVFGSE